MADRWQAVTAFYKFVLHKPKIIQKRIILFFDASFDITYGVDLNDTGMAAG